YPYSLEAKKRKAEGTFSDAPFMSPATVLDTALSPDFLIAGDFDADGHNDLLVASRADNTLYFLGGDGGGNFKPAQAIVLPGKVTALATGEVNRADGLPDFAVAVSNNGINKLMVFEGYQGALKSQPEVLDLPGAANDLQIGFLSKSYEGDIAVATGRE